MNNTVLRGFVRTALNPARAMANVAGARALWHRAGRPLSPSTDLVSGLRLMHGD